MSDHDESKIFASNSVEMKAAAESLVGVNQTYGKATVVRYTAKHHRIATKLDNDNKTKTAIWAEENGKILWTYGQNNSILTIHLELIHD